MEVRETNCVVRMTEHATRTMMNIVTLNDRSRIRPFLNTNRDWAVYALGDLDPDLYQLSDWFGALEGEGLRSLALVFKGLEPPVVFTLGDPIGVEQILDRGLHVRSIYLSIREEHLTAIEAHYHIHARQPMWRMILEPGDFRSIEGEVNSLTMADFEELTRLYALGGGDAFSRSQLSGGLFYGIKQAGRVVAVAGTHIISIGESVAAIGNVMTDPDHRNRGYASIVTGAVCAEIIRRGIGTIALNVAQSNPAAIHVYEKLGFKKVMPFYEGIALRKE